MANEFVARKGLVSEGNLYAKLDAHLEGNAYVYETIGSTQFASGFAGYGIKLQQDAQGKWALDLDSLTVRGQMRIYELFINQIKATNGSVFVSSTGKVDNVSINAVEKITNDLLGHWTFDGNDLDYSAYKNNAVLGSSSFYTTNAIIGAQSLTRSNSTGTTTYIPLANSPLLGLSQFTMSFWIYNSDVEDYDDVFVIANSGGSSLFKMESRVTDTQFQFVGASGFFADGSVISGITSNAWTLITIVADGTNVKIYENAGSVNTFAQTGNFPATAHRLYLQADIAGGVSEINPSPLNDLRFYGRALTETEVTALYNLSTQEVYPSYGLAAYYNFNDAGTVNAVDYTGNGYTTAFVGSPIIVDGVIGKAFKTTSNAQYYEVGGLNTHFTGNQATAVSAWVKRTGTIATTSGFWGIGTNSSLQGITNYNHTTADAISIDLWGTCTYQATGQTYPLDTWVHVVWVYYGTAFTTANCAIFVNGVKYTGGSLTALRGTTGVLSYQASAKLAVGRIHSGSATAGAPVEIEDFRLYNRALTDSEVTALYNNRGGIEITTPDDANHGFLVGDLIRSQRFTGNDVYKSDLVVNYSAGLNKFYAEPISLANPSIDLPRPGYEYVRLGNIYNTSRQGAVYMTADDSGAPFMDVIDGINSFATFNTVGTNKARLGKLSGIVDTALGLNASSVYGLYTGSLYAKGNLVVGGSVNAITLSASTIAIGNVTGSANTAIKISNTGTPETSGIFGYNNAGNSVFELTLNNTAKIAAFSFDKDRIFTSTFELDATNSIFRLGSTLPTAYNNGTGIWMGNDGGTYKVFIGASAGNKLTFDGTNLSITGALTATTGAIGGFFIDSGNLWAGNATLGSTSTNIVLSSTNTKVALAPTGTAANAITIAGTEVGTIITEAGFKTYGDGSNYIRRNGASLDIKAATFNLTAAGLIITSGTQAAVSGDIVLSGATNQIYVGTGVNLDGTTTGSIKVGSATAFATGSGIYLDGGGNLRAGLISASVLTNGISWDGTVFLVRSNSTTILSAQSSGATIAGWTATDTRFSSGTSEAGTANNRYRISLNTDFLGGAGNEIYKNSFRARGLLQQFHNTGIHNGFLQVGQLFTLVGNVATASTYHGIEMRYGAAAANLAFRLSANIDGAVGDIDNQIAGWAFTNTTLSSTNIRLVSGAAGTSRLELGDGSTANLTAGVKSPSVTGDIVFWAGQVTGSATTAPFRVSAAGALTATSGLVAGWELNANYLRANNGGTYGTNLVNIMLNKVTHGSDSALAAPGGLQGLHITGYENTSSATGFRLGFGQIGSGQFYQTTESTGYYGIEGVYGVNSGGWATSTMFRLAYRVTDGAIDAQIAGWVFDNQAIYKGTKVTAAGYATNIGDITISSAIGISTKNFYIDIATGNAYFRGDISAATGTFTGGVSGTGYTLNNSGLNLTNTSSSISLGNSVVLNSSGLSGTGFSLTTSGVTATSGSIGGWYLNTTDLWAGNASLASATIVMDSSATKLALGATADSISMTAGTGFYADGTGAFRVGGFINSISDGISYLPGQRITLGTSTDIYGDVIAYGSAATHPNETVNLRFNGNLTDSVGGISVLDTGSVNLTNAGVGGGTCATFSGSNNLYTTSAVMRPTTAFTLSVFVKLTNWAAASQSFVGIRQNNNGYYLGTQAAGVLRFSMGNNTTSKTLEYTFPVTPTAGSWHHVVATLDSAGLMLLYFDGALVGTSAAGAMAPNYSSMTTVFIGGDNNGSNAVENRMTGALDDLQMFNKALSASEIYAIYARVRGYIDSTANGIYLGTIKDANGEFTKGILGTSGGLALFQLGVTNHIAGWNISSGLINKTVGNYSSGIDATNQSIYIYNAGTTAANMFRIAGIGQVFNGSTYNAGEYGLYVVKRNAANSAYEFLMRVSRDGSTDRAIIAGWDFTATTFSSTNIRLISGAAGTSRLELGDGTTANLTAGVKSSAGNNTDVVFWAGQVTGSATSAPFRVTAGGVLTATSATISGTLTAGSGSAIGSWTVSTGIYNGKTAFANATAGIWIGTDGIALGSGAAAPFNVTSAGVLTAISGAIGGWTLASAQISSGATTTFSDSSQRIALRQGSTIIGTNIYNSSQTTMKGLSIQWSQNSNAGQMVFGELPVDSNGVPVTSSTGFSSGWYGIQAMRWDQTTPFFQLAFKATGTAIVTNHSIAGWAFDTAKFSSTNIRLVAGAAGDSRLELGNGSTANLTAGVKSPAATGDVVFWAGETSANAVNAPFWVTAGGALRATNATITGTITSGNITATGGTIAGWILDPNYITKLVDSDTKQLTINSGVSSIYYYDSSPATNEVTGAFLGQLYNPNSGLFDGTYGLRVTKWNGSSHEYVLNVSGTTAQISGWDISMDRIAKINGDHQIIMSSALDSVYYYNSNGSTANKVRFVGMGKLYDNSGWTSNYGFIVVSRNSTNTAYETRMEISGTTAKIAGWDFTSSTLSKLNSGAGIELTAGGTAATTYIKMYKSSGLDTLRFQATNTWESVTTLLNRDTQVGSTITETLNNTLSDGAANIPAGDYYLELQTSASIYIGDSLGEYDVFVEIHDGTSTIQEYTLRRGNLIAGFFYFLTGADNALTIPFSITSTKTIYFRINTNAGSGTAALGATVTGKIRAATPFNHYTNKGVTFYSAPKHFIRISDQSVSISGTVNFDQGNFNFGRSGYDETNLFRFLGGSSVFFDGFVRMGGDGAGYVRLTTSYVYATALSTSGGGTALYVQADGKLTKLSSSVRYKRNITDLHLDLTLSDYLSLEPKAYNWKDDKLSTERYYGFVAEEVDKVHPAFVIRGQNGEVEGIKYNDFIAANFMAIKHIYSETDLLKQKVAKLEKELDIMRKKLDQRDIK